jgi:predicted component of type VI protein secretion system
MALVVSVSQSDGSLKQMSFFASPVRVGRNMLNEVHLEDQRVSQWHAIIRFDEETGEILLMDLGSTNGTAHNGALLQARVPVTVGPNDRLGVGGHQLKLHLADVPAEQPPPDRYSNFETQGKGGYPPAELSEEYQLAAAQGAQSRGAPGGARDGSQEIPLLNDTLSELNEASALAEVPTTQYQPPVRDHGTGHQPSFSDLLHQAVAEAGPAHEQYRQARRAALLQLRSSLVRAPKHFREHVALALKAAYPDLARESDFRQLLQEQGLSANIDDYVDPAEWLHRLKTGGKTGSRENINARVAMERTGALMETFAESFIALRRGYEQFGEDMGLEVFQDRNALTEVRDYRGALQVLLDWQAEGNQAVDDLRRAFTDLAMHQVAVVHGVVEGVRELLQKLSPAGLTGNAKALSRPGLLNSLLAPFRRRRQWNAYVKKHRRLVEEDRFVREIFGKAFARAYFNIAGGNQDDGQGQQSS